MRPSESLFAITNQTTFHHWYARTHLPPPLHRRRYSSSILNNMWNAGSNWDNALQGNSAGLLATMRTQVTNLKSMIDASVLIVTQKPLVQRLIAEVT